jgi:hypothetical protein
MTSLFRTKLDKIMTAIGYKKAIEGKTDLEIIDLIEAEFINLSELDESESYELAKYDLKDSFFQKQWIDINMLVSDDKLEQLYNLLCDWKRSSQ